MRTAAWTMVCFLCGACGAPATTVVEHTPVVHAPPEPEVMSLVDWQACIRRMRPVARPDGLRELVLDARAHEDDACAREAERQERLNNRRQRPGFAELYAAARRALSDRGTMLVGWYSGPDPWEYDDPAPFVMQVERVEGVRVWLPRWHELADCAAPGPLAAERLLRTEVLASNPWTNAHPFFAVPRTDGPIEVVIDILLAPTTCWVVRSLGDVDALPFTEGSRARVRGELSAIDFGASVIVVIGPEEEWPERVQLDAAQLGPISEESTTYQQHGDVVEVHAWRSPGGWGCSPFPRPSHSGPGPASVLIAPLVALPRATMRVRVTIDTLGPGPPCA